MSLLSVSRRCSFRPLFYLLLCTSALNLSACVSSLSGNTSSSYDIAGTPNPDGGSTGTSSGEGSCSGTSSGEGSCSGTTSGGSDTGTTSGGDTGTTSQTYPDNVVLSRYGQETNGSYQYTESGGVLKIADKTYTFPNYASDSSDGRAKILNGGLSDGSGVKVFGLVEGTDLNTDNPNYESVKIAVVGDKTAPETLPTTDASYRGNTSIINIGTGDVSPGTFVAVAHFGEETPNVDMHSQIQTRSQSGEEMTVLGQMSNAPITGNSFEGTTYLTGPSASGQIETYGGFYGENGSQIAGGGTGNVQIGNQDVHAGFGFRGDME